MRPDPNNPATGLQKIIVTLVLLCSSFVIPVGTAGGGSTRPKKTYSHASLRAMARIYIASGSYDKAQPVLESALDLARTSDASDSDLCACMLDLAYLYKNQGRLAEAETICLEGMKLQEKVYGAKHPYVAYTLRILSEIYREQGRYREAGNCLQQAMTIMRTVSSEDDPDIAPLTVDMARLMVAQGELAQADVLFNKAMALIEDSYGPRHLYTTKVLTSIAALRVLQGRYAQAEALICRILPVQEKVYGANPHFLIPAWLVMSKVYKARGDMANARTLLARSFDAAENQTNPFCLLDVLETLVQLHRETGNVSEVAKLQKRIEKIRANRQYAYARSAQTVQ